MKIENRAIIVIGLVLALGCIVAGLSASLFKNQITHLPDSMFDIQNQASSAITVKIDFPSGKSHQLTLQPSTNQYITEKNPGTGTVTVSIPARPTQSFNFVTFPDYNILVIHNQTIVSTQKPID